MPNSITSPPIHYDPESYPTRLLQRYSTFCIGQTCSNTPIHAGCCTVKVLSAVPPLALVAVDGLELQGKNLVYMYSSTHRGRCNFAVAARQEFAVVASTTVVAVAGVMEEHVVEVDRFAVVGANLGDSVLEMVPRHSCCDLVAVVDTSEEVRSAAGFGCNMLPLDLPWSAFAEAVPWVMVGIAGDFEADWEDSRMVPASDLANVSSFVSWTLVEALGRCAAGADHK